VLGIVATSAQPHVHLLSVGFNGVVDQFLWVEHATTRIAILEGLVNLGVGDAVTIAVPWPAVGFRAQVRVRVEVGTSHVAVPTVTVTIHVLSAVSAMHVIPFC
jgi:hypothetical protein